MRTSAQRFIVEPNDSLGQSVVEGLGTLPQQLGGSTKRFAPGRGADGNGANRQSIGFWVVDASPEVREQAYSYVYASSVLNQKIRPMIFTSSNDLKAIRRFGWLVEHVLSRESFERLSDGEWNEYLSSRLEGALSSLDLKAVVFVGKNGITPYLHKQVSLITKTSSPLSALT